MRDIGHTMFENVTNGFPQAGLDALCSFPGLPESAPMWLFEKRPYAPERWRKRRLQD